MHLCTYVHARRREAFVLQCVGACVDEANVYKPTSRISLSPVSPSRRRAVGESEAGAGGTLTTRIDIKTELGTNITNRGR